MNEQGCRSLCMGLGIHFPYFVDTGFQAKTGRREDACFSRSQKADFSGYLHRALLPALECAFEWLDSGDALTFSASGLAIEQLLEDETDGMDLLVQAMSHRCADVLGQTYYHSVAGLFSEKDEFIYQAGRHAERVEALTGKRPEIFQHTEYVFDSNLADIIRDLGFSALYSEGYDHILSGPNPNYVYSCRELPVLLRNCRLSDDIAHRFHDHTWDQYPLSSEKFAGWIAKTPGKCVHIFLDATVFAGNGRAAGSFREFFCDLPYAFRQQHIMTILPGSVIGDPPEREIRLEDLGRCSPDGTCALTGIRNMLQQSAYWCLEDSTVLVTEKEPWRRLQSTDHFTRMAITSGSCGRLTSRSTSQEAYTYFSAYMRVLAHCEAVSSPQHRSRLAAKALRCLPPEKAFHFHSAFRYIGYSAYSLKEFSRLLEFIPDDVFRFHQERDDFSRWITEVLGDAKLAARIKQCTGSAEAAEVVGERVGELCRRLR
jgi:alpha-amylase